MPALCNRLYFPFFVFIFFLDQTISDAPGLCPLGETGGVAKARCHEDVTCAIFDGVQPQCIGWARNRCLARQYRDLKTCMCINCPRGQGELCTPASECCSLADCSRGPTTPPTTTPAPKPKWYTEVYGLASRPTPTLASRMLLMLLVLLTVAHAVLHC
jgi:hypothetical protein